MHHWQPPIQLKEQKKGRVLQATTLITLHGEGSMAGQHLPMQVEGPLPIMPGAVEEQMQLLFHGFTV
jgi:hypothetical protein